MIASPLKKYWCATNWKLHKSPQEAGAFVDVLLQKAPTFSVCQLVLYPQNFSCLLVAEKVAKTDVIWGGQNIYPQPSGPYTGENSPNLLKAMEAHTVLIGHSERRLLFDERDDLIAQKIWASTQAGLIPLLCVGETIEEYHSQQTKDVVARQIRTGLSLINHEVPVAIAYEPVWAIGTGKTATLEVIEDVHSSIKDLLASMKRRQTSILYGGSVKPGNAKDLAVGQHIDGFLVGGAGLQVDSFLEIAKALESTKLT